MRRRVLITGSSGMLGVDLCHELRRDYEVYGMDVVRPARKASAGRRPSGAGCKFIAGDITDRPGIIGIIGKVKPDVVIHAAAWTDVDECELDEDKAKRVNYEGTKYVARACGEAGSILVYISTDFVFDGRKKTPYKESDRPSPISSYGYSKLKGEEAVRKAVKRYFILRTSWLYGKSGKNFVDAILAKARSEKVLKVVDDQIGSPTYAKDLAKAIHVLLNLIVPSSQFPVPRYGIYHVTNAGRVSWYDYARRIIRFAGLKIRVVPISSKELNRPAKRPAMSVLNNSKFARFTGFKMRPWNQALEEYLKSR